MEDGGGSHGGVENLIDNLYIYVFVCVCMYVCHP